MLIKNSRFYSLSEYVFAFFVEVTFALLLFSIFFWTFDFGHCHNDYYLNILIRHGSDAMRIPIKHHIFSAFQ